MSGDWPHSSLILVVDDDDAMRSSLAEALTSDSHTVLGAETAQRAVALLQQAARFPDLVVLDVDLPDASGLDLLSSIRALPAAERARYVIISGGREHDIPADVTFVQKPFILGAFLQTVRAELAGRRPARRGGEFDVEVAPPLRALLERASEKVRRELEAAIDLLCRDPRPRSAIWDGPAQYRLATPSGWVRYRVDTTQRKIVLVEGAVR